MCRPPSCLWFPEFCLFSVWVFPLSHPPCFDLNCFLPYVHIRRFCFCLCHLLPQLSVAWVNHLAVLVRWKPQGGMWSPEFPCFQTSFNVFFHLGILYFRHFPNYLGKVSRLNMSLVWIPQPKISPHLILSRPKSHFQIKWKSSYNEPLWTGPFAAMITSPQIKHFDISSPVWHIYRPHLCIVKHGPNVVTTPWRHLSAATLHIQGGWR